MTERKVAAASCPASRPVALDVIVRTMADTSRATCLGRALDSIQQQVGVAARPIVVVNGQRADPDVVAMLRARAGIVLHFEAEASPRLARIAGRRLVTAPYFGYLDDDDELVPDVLRMSLEWLESHSDCGLVVTNGHLERHDGTLDPLTKLAALVHGGDVVEALLEDNWLVPGAFVARGAALTPALLGSEWGHMEWTHLAYVLSVAGICPHFIDVPGVVIHYTPGSMSRQAQHQEASLKLLQLIAGDARLGRRVRRMARDRIGRLHHGLCAMAAREDRFRLAWKHHLLSLRPPRPLRYLLYTRRLVAASWRRRRRS